MWVRLWFSSNRIALFHFGPWILDLHLKVGLSIVMSVRLKTSYLLFTCEPSLPLYVCIYPQNLPGFLLQNLFHPSEHLRSQKLKWVGDVSQNFQKKKAPSLFCLFSKISKRDTRFFFKIQELLDPVWRNHSCTRSTRVHIV